MVLTSLRKIAKNCSYQVRAAMFVGLMFLSTAVMLFNTDGIIQKQQSSGKILAKTSSFLYSNYNDILSFQTKLIISQLLLDSSDTKLQEYIESKEEQEKELIKIMEEQAKEKAKKAEKEETKENTKKSAQPSSRSSSKEIWNVSATERAWLEKIVMAEAGGEPFEGQIAVANVVLNRVKAGFGKSIYDVIFQKGQFTPVTNGTIYKVKPSESVKKAVSAALNGEKAVDDDVLYFLNPSIATNFWIPKTRTFAKKIGNHHFYK